MCTVVLVSGKGGGGVVCGGIGKELFYMILWMMFSSCWYSSSCKSYEFNLLYKNLLAAYFCCVGWFEVNGDNGVCECRLSVIGGFPVGGGFCIDMSK